MVDEEVIDDPQNPPLPKGFTAIKSVGTPPLPKGFTPIEKKNDSPFPTHGYQPTSQDLKDRQHLNDIENGFDKLPNTLPQSNSSLNPFQNSQESSDLSPVLPENRDMVRQQQKQASQRISDNLKAQQNALDPEHKEAFGKAASLITPPSAINEDKIGAEHYNYMQTPIGKTLGALQYMGSKATKGTLQIAKGAAYLAQLGGNPIAAATGTQDQSIDDVFKKADENTNFGLTKGDQQRMSDNPITANLGGLAEFLPAAAAASGTGGATFYLQGLGQGKEAIDAAEKQHGSPINPIVKNAFILGTGAVNGLLMGELGSSMFKSLPAGLRGDITASITADAIKEASGKELTADEFTNLLHKGAQEFGDKVKRGGIATLEGYKHVVTNLSALSGANFALKKGVDVTSDKPVFGETVGDLASNLNDIATKQAPFFAIPSAIGAASKLTPYSDYKNTVVESLMHDSTDSNLAKTKEDIATYGQQNDWSPSEIQDTQSHVDKIGEVAKVLPKNLPEKKVGDAVDLVLGRKQLEAELAQEQTQRKQLDPAISDVISPNEQLLTDKIEQANDKLRNIATGSKTTYSKGIGDDEGKFFKTTNSKVEEISPSRYDLEVAERLSSKITEPELPIQIDNINKQEPIKQQENESKSNNQESGSENTEEKSGSGGSQESDTEQKIVAHNGEKGDVVTTDEAKVEPESKPKWIDEDDYEFDEDSEKFKIGETKNFNAHNGRGYLEFEFKDPNKEKIQNDALDTPIKVNLENDNFNRVHINGIADELQNKGLGKEIYNALIDKYGIISTSEASSSKDIKRVWNSLIKSGKYFWANVGDNYIAVAKSKAEIDRFVKDKSDNFNEEIPVERGEPNEVKSTTPPKDNTGATESVDKPVQQADEKTTSIKNATTTDERQERGMPEVERLAKRSFPEVYEKAKQAVANGTIDPRSLAEHISKNPRSLAPEESVALALDRMKLSNEYSETTERLKDAYEKEDMSAIGELEHRLSTIEKQTEHNDEASLRSGYEQGLGLAVRLLIIKEDYTVLNKIREAKIANNGKEIPIETKAKIEELTKKLQDGIKRQEELEDRVSKLEAEKSIKRTISASKSKPRASLKEDLNDILSDFKKEFKLAGKSHTLKSDIPYRQELYAASKFIARVAARLVEEGVHDATEIAKQVRDLFKEDIEGISERDIYDVLAGKYSDRQPTKSEVSKQLSDIKKQADLIGKIEDAERGDRQRSKSKGETIVSEKTKELRDQLKALTKDDISLESAKKRALTQQAELKRRLSDGDYSKLEANKPQYDYEYNKIKADNEKLKRQIDGEIHKLRMENRTKFEKSLDYVNAWRRGALLSRVGTLFKLGAAAGERLITTPIEEGIGGGINKIPLINKIARNAPREGGSLSIKAESAAFSDTFSKKVLQDMAETIKHGHGSLDYAHGKRIPIQSGGFEGIMEFPGKVHGAIKVIPKRNEFFRSFVKRVEFAKKQGLDVTNQLVLESIQADSYKDAQRSIFMSDNMLTDGYRKVINSLENTKDPNTKNRNKIAAAIMKFLLPIVKVPTNFALETTNYAAGSLRAIPHIIKAATKGAESLTPEQSDFVLRALKKNSIGLAMLALGYYNPKAIGGYYQQGKKRKDGEAQFGDVNVFGVHLPHFLLHAPVLEVLQVGATLRRVKDKYERKHHGGNGEWAGGVAAIKGVSGNIPFFDAPQRIGDAIKSEKSAEYYLGEQAKSFTVPGIVQEGAELGDKKAKPNSDAIDYILVKPNKRDMGSILDHIQSGIPGARNMLPHKK